VIVSAIPRSSDLWRFKLGSPSTDISISVVSLAYDYLLSCAVEKVQQTVIILVSPFVVFEGLVGVC